MRSLVVQSALFLAATVLSFTTGYSQTYIPAQKGHAEWFSPGDGQSETSSWKSTCQSRKNAAGAAKSDADYAKGDYCGEMSDVEQALISKNIAQSSNPAWPAAKSSFESDISAMDCDYLAVVATFNALISDLSAADLLYNDGRDLLNAGKLESGQTAMNIFDAAWDKFNPSSYQHFFLKASFEAVKAQFEALKARATAIKNAINAW